MILIPNPLKHEKISIIFKYCVQKFRKNIYWCILALFANVEAKQNDLKNENVFKKYVIEFNFAQLFIFLQNRQNRCTLMYTG